MKSCIHTGDVKGPSVFHKPNTSYEVPLRLVVSDMCISALTNPGQVFRRTVLPFCLLYTTNAADDLTSQ